MSASTVAFDQRGLLVVLAGHAPGGGEVHEHTLPLRGELVNPARRPGLPAAGYRCSRRDGDRPGDVRAHGPEAPLRTARGRKPPARSRAVPRQQAQITSADQRPARPAARPPSTPALLAQHPDQPGDGGEHREGHQLAEGHHPGPGRGSDAGHGGDGAGRQVGQRHADAEGRENRQGLQATASATRIPSDAPMKGAVQGEAIGRGQHAGRNASTRRVLRPPARDAGPAGDCRIRTGPPGSGPAA